MEIADITKSVVLFFKMVAIIPCAPLKVLTVLTVQNDD